MVKRIAFFVSVLILLTSLISCSGSGLETNRKLLNEMNKEYSAFQKLKSEYLRYSQIETSLTKSLLFQRQEMVMMKEESKKNLVLALFASKSISDARDISVSMLKQRDRINIQKIRIYNRLSYCITRYNDLAINLSDRELTLNAFPSHISSIDLNEEWY